MNKIKILYFLLREKKVNENKKQANQLAHIINSNTVFMNIIDDLPPPEFHYVSLAEWEKFKTEGRKWQDHRIVVC